MPPLLTAETVVSDVASAGRLRGGHELSAHARRRAVRETPDAQGYGGRGVLSSSHSSSRSQTPWLSDGALVCIVASTRASAACQRVNKQRAKNDRVAQAYSEDRYAGSFLHASCQGLLFPSRSLTHAT